MAEDTICTSNEEIESYLCVGPEVVFGVLLSVPKGFDILVERRIFSVQGSFMCGDGLANIGENSVDGFLIRRCHGLPCDVVRVVFVCHGSGISRKPLEIREIGKRSKHRLVFRVKGRVTLEQMTYGESVEAMLGVRFERF